MEATTASVKRCQPKSRWLLALPASTVRTVLGRETPCRPRAINGESPSWNLIGFFDDGVAAGTENEYGRVLGTVDGVLLTEVYPAGEAPIVAADGRALARALRLAGRVEPLFVANVADLPQPIADNARPGAVVLCMGAGSIGQVAANTRELAS